MAIECTQAEYDTLLAAIKSGVTRVAYSDKSVQYDSLVEMRKIAAEMKEFLDGSSSPARFSRASYSRD